MKETNYAEKIAALGLNKDDIRILEAYGYTIEMNLSECGVCSFEEDAIVAAAELLRLYDELLGKLLVNGITKEDVEDCMCWYVTDKMRETLSE